MNILALYYVVVVVLSFVGASLWFNLSSADGGDTKQRLKSAASMTWQMTVCSLGYGVFFFVLMLSIGIALWLIMLGLVYLPMDVLSNALGDHWSDSIVKAIMPYVNRSAHSPGLFDQPILDYATLSALFLAPAAGIRTIIISGKARGGNSRDKTGNNEINNDKNGTVGNFSFRKNSA